MSEDNLLTPKTTGEMFNEIYISYLGGLVEIYIPEGSNLFLQEVNAEYPEAMCKDVPGGKVKYFEGDLDLNDPNSFGFLKLILSLITILIFQYYQLNIIIIPCVQLGSGLAGILVKNLDKLKINMVIKLLFCVVISLKELMFLMIMLILYILRKKYP